VLPPIGLHWKQVQFFILPYFPARQTGSACTTKNAVAFAPSCIHPPPAARFCPGAGFIPTVIINDRWTTLEFSAQAFDKAKIREWNQGSLSAALGMTSREAKLRAQTPADFVLIARSKLQLSLLRLCHYFYSAAK
jgi:hypothetical protein